MHISGFSTRGVQSVAIHPPAGFDQSQGWIPVPRDRPYTVGRK